MKNFKSIDGIDYELNGEFEEKGIFENQDGLYELCDKSNENSFTTVNVICEDNTYYVDFNEPSEWTESNVIVGLFE